MSDKAPPPAQPLAPGNYDRAWNDPPLFSYSTSAAAQPVTANRLNKRVAFPTSKATAPAPGLDPTAPPALYDAGMRPPPGALPPPPPPALMTAADQEAEPSTHVKSELDVEAVENAFNELVEKYFSDKNRDEMKRRFASLFVSWKQGGYNSNVQQLLMDIGQSLLKADIGLAEAKFTVLGADWSSLVGPNNILIIKKLITAAREEIDDGNRDSSAVTKPL